MAALERAPSPKCRLSFNLLMRGPLLRGLFALLAGPRRPKSTMVTKDRAQLLQDLRDVRVWLETHHPGTGAKLSVHWAGKQPGRDIANILVHGRGDPAVHASLRRDACRAMTTLGYRLDPDARGAHRFIEFADTRSMSAHARLEAIWRINDAVAGA